LRSRRVTGKTRPQGPGSSLLGRNWLAAILIFGDDRLDIVFDCGALNVRFQAKNHPRQRLPIVTIWPPPTKLTFETVVPLPHAVDPSKGIESRLPAGMAAAFAATMSLAALGGAVLSSSFAPAFAEMTVEVGGALIYPSKTIIENAVKSKDHTTLVAAIKAADLVETLQGDGTFTVFSPVNKAFEKLPKDTVEALLKPENKATLTAVLTHM
jgi:Fasciclin domain